MPIEPVKIFRKMSGLGTEPVRFRNEKKKQNKLSKPRPASSPYFPLLADHLFAFPFTIHTATPSLPNFSIFIHSDTITPSDHPDCH